MPDLRDKTAGPASTYHRVDGSWGSRRSYTITVSLSPGYGSVGSQLGDGELVPVHQEWMAERIRKGRPYLTGVFIRGLLSYAWPRPETGDPQVRTEQVAQFTGDMSTLYAFDVLDGDVEAMLDELAARLGAALDQVRVYVTYLDRAWVLEVTDV